MMTLATRLRSFKTRFDGNQPRRTGRRPASHKSATARLHLERLEERLLLSGFGPQDGAYIVAPGLGTYEAVKIQPGDQKTLDDRTLLSASYLPNELLVQFQPGASAVARAEARSAVQGELVQPMHTSAMIAAGQGILERIYLPTGTTVEHAKQMLEHNPNVQYAEPNWVYSTQAVSDDPYYTTSSRLWGMYSDDSPGPVGPAGTTNQYGSQAEEAWNAGYTGSSSVFVGIVDEGFQYAHPDLVANSWTNPYDPSDGIDNDGNGYAAASQLDYQQCVRL